MLTVLHRPDSSDTITVLAGQDEKPFTVHKNVLCKNAPYFNAASSDQWQRDGEEGVARLTSVDEETFQMYVHWAYTGTVNPNIGEVCD